MHSTLGHAYVLSGQSSHGAPTCGQSALVTHWLVEQTGNAWPQLPESSQYMSTARSAQVGSAGSHRLHSAPHGLFAQGS
jgi:hypothetical protein